MRIGRAEGPSAVFSTSLAFAFQYPKMLHPRFLGACSTLGARTTASGFSVATSPVFSVRLTSDANVDGAAELAREANAERRVQTSLMSFSSKSRVVGMISSRLYAQVTRTRSSR